MKKYHIIPILFWIGLSLFVMAVSYKYGLGKFHNPGPGFMPFLLGLLLLGISFYPLMSFLFRKGKRDKRVEEMESKLYFGKISLVLASLFAYAFLLDKLGYLVDTFLLLIILFRSAGFKKWSSVLIASGLTALATYFVFNMLGLRFPTGILKRILS